MNFQLRAGLFILCCNYNGIPRQSKSSPEVRRSTFFREIIYHRDYKTESMFTCLHFTNVCSRHFANACTNIEPPARPDGPECLFDQHSNAIARAGRSGAIKTANKPPDRNCIPSTHTRKKKKPRWQSSVSTLRSPAHVYKTGKLIDSRLLMFHDQLICNYWRSLFVL